jgi:hypothetical protein
LLDAAKTGTKALMFAPRELKSSRDFMLEAIRRSGGLAMMRATPALRRDKDFVLEALSSSSDVELLRGVYGSLLYDRDFMLRAVAINGAALRHANVDFKADRDFVLQAVQLNGSALGYVDACLKCDREVVIAAVRQHWSAVIYVEELTSEILEEVACQWPEGPTDEHVVVLRPSGERIDVEYSEGMTAGDLKVSLALVTGIPTERQHLTYSDAARPLRNADVLFKPARLPLSEMTSRICRRAPDLTLIVS